MGILDRLFGRKEASTESGCESLDRRKMPACNPQASLGATRGLRQARADIVLRLRDLRGNVSRREQGESLMATVGEERARESGD